MTADTIEIDIQIHKSTATHIWVSTSGDRRDAVQLRRSSVRIESRSQGGLAVMAIGERLAIEKGLA
ncbi:hypothetical protein [Poseidonocella sp. HB161398]|uniref:hypothetical protein n=1 Tax=Poseidonocella sp. HB161398 TaxID=2320855 RepID=UPI00110944C5|nr:hypothetical protein [Poseidonocella sp. HB161398]